MIFMKNSRNIGYTKQHFLYQVSNVDFGPTIGFRLMKQIHGGFDMVGVTVNDCKNQKKKISFTKINHNYRFITFASGLLADETVGAYIWLLKQFKEAFGKDPKVVVNDQDPSMKIAIAECFPDTRHRLCMWHIMMKLGTKVGATLCNRTNQILPKIFEREWECMINEFELGENKWLGDMFNLRESWIHVPHLTLIEFLSHYDTAIDYQRYIERKNDHDSRYKTPAFKTDLPMEKEACKLYTRTLFFDVQDEMFASYKYCIALSVVQTENTETYSVRDTQYHIFKGSDQFPFYQNPKVQAAPKEKAAPKQQASQPRRSGLRSSTPK
ncbi:FAR1 DNA binding domain, zinc finger, SWIM-type, MULE transposase domain containing protein [Tanacetum coccineum]